MNQANPGAGQARPAGRRRRRSSPLKFIFLFGLAALVCLVPVLVAAGLVALTGQAAAQFGPPAPGMSFIRQARLAAQLLMNRQKLLEPANPAGDSQPFDIALGESPQSIAARLEQLGLVRDGRAFTVYLQYAGLDRTIQAGAHQLSPALTAVELARALQDATPTEVTLSVLEGWRLEEIAATLPTSGLEFSPQDFLQAARTPPQDYPFLAELPPGNSLEGFLFPGSYRLPRETSARQVIATLLDGFAAALTPELLSGFEQQGLTVYQAVTLASIVEREAIVKDEMPLIASVLLNRQAAGMRLEADSTVQYAFGYNQIQGTWWTNPLSSQDLQVESPYNTYRYVGLPPGPIANPGGSALRAVAYPARTPYYYFRAACDGSGRHSFAETYSEHLENACP